MAQTLGPVELRAWAVRVFTSWDLQERCKALVEVKADGTQQLEELVSAKSPRRSRHRIGRAALHWVIYDSETPKKGKKA
eukprot:5206100-Amphidinium_carterae.1